LELLAWCFSGGWRLVLEDLTTAEALPEEEALAKVDLSSIALAKEDRCPGKERRGV